MDMEFLKCRVIRNNRNNKAQNLSYIYIMIIRDKVKSNKKSIIVHNILGLCYLYSVIALFFAIIYLLLDMFDLGTIYDHTVIYDSHNLIDLVSGYVYFSFITMTAIGYGDLVPLGLARFFAIVQALIGYILPYAIILNYTIFNPKFLRFLHINQDNLKG